MNYTPWFDTEAGITSSVQTLEGFHRLLEARRKCKTKMNKWLVYGKWVLLPRCYRYIWPWFRDLDLDLPDVIEFDSLSHRTPRFNDLKLSPSHREFLVERHQADDLIGAIRCGMFDPLQGNFITHLLAPSNSRCPLCGIGWTSWNAEWHIIRNQQFRKWGLEDGSVWHPACNLVDLGPSVEPKYRQFLKESGFQIYNVQYERNGHAGYPHMPPWCAYKTDMGKIRMGWLVSALHIDYRGTTFTGDLLPEKPERSRNPAQTIEVEGEEIPLCLNRLRQALAV